MNKTKASKALTTHSSGLSRPPVLKGTAAEFKR